MTRHILPLILLLIAACGLEELDAIIAKYDTFGSTGTTVDSDSSTGSTGTTTGTTALDTTSTTGTLDTTGGLEASAEASGSSTTDADTGSSSTTGPPPPFCGDGIVDPDETCDDMNDDPDDGCKLCTKDRLVFVTSEVFQGFKLGGLFIADQRCRMLAGIAGFPNVLSFRAWLSDSTTAAADRITHSRGRYVLPNGLVVARDWDALVSGDLEIPIKVTEKSETASSNRAWTGTHANGQPSFGSPFCGDWVGDDPFQFGGSGVSTFTDGGWSFYHHVPCGAESAIYCFEN